MRILVADDDEICRDMLEHMLKTAGHEVLAVADGDAAWEALQAQPWQLIISDWDMPKLDGPGLCRRIREGDFDQYLYLILLTARDSKEELVTGLSSGADAFINKPVTTAELLAHVQAAERVLSLETREVAIFALARLAESRDQETGEHLERVRSYARLLAQELTKDAEYQHQIDAEFIRLLYLTSPLHDIGKVGIPDSVLLKPGRLTEEEFGIMQRHATIGAETLDAALQRFPQVRFLMMARAIAASHHERWDGRGYPEQLAGTAIPLCARLVSVADVYDALTTKRCYKEAYSHSTAVEIIHEGRGTQFDPKIVDAFLRIHDRFQLIHDRYQSPCDAETPNPDSVDKPSTSLHVSKS